MRPALVQKGPYFLGGVMGEHWTVTKRRDLRELNEYVDQLEKRHTVLILSVSELAQGIGCKPAYYNNKTHTWDTCMKHKAAIDLASVAEMPLNKRKYIYL